MRTEIRIAPQVEAFVKSLAPEPRQAVKRAIRGLARDEGDIKVLEGKLSDWRRLRAGSIRIIYQEKAEKGVRVLHCVYANHRGVVYEMLAKLLAEQLISN